MLIFKVVLQFNNTNSVPLFGKISFLQFDLTAIQFYLGQLHFRQPHWCHPRTIVFRFIPFRRVKKMSYAHGFYNLRNITS